MNIPSWFTDMIEKLEQELTCPKLPLSHDGYLYVWDIKDRNIQFQVHYTDAEVLVRIRDGVNIIDSEETDDPKKVIQKTKEFKSKYFKYLE